jgi:hypothetical protein
LSLFSKVPTNRPVAAQVVGRASSQRRLFSRSVAQHIDRQGEGGRRAGDGNSSVAKRASDPETNRAATRPIFLEAGLALPISLSSLD